MAKKKLNPQSILLLTVLHVVAAVAIWNIFRAPPEAKVWVLFVVLWLIPQFGITVGYHRMETHNGFKCRRWVRVVLLVCGGMAVQGDVNGWVLNHRVHHRFEDQPGLDLHSPLEYPGIKGLAWAHVGWLLCRYERPVQFRKSSRFEADAFVQWQRRWYLVLAAMSFAIPFAVAGWDGLLVAGFLRVVMVLHITWSTNSLCHKWGRRRPILWGIRTWATTAATTAWWNSSASARATTPTTTRNRLARSTDGSASALIRRSG